MPCDPRCDFTAMLNEKGERLMISMGGNSKFPHRFLHPMCRECRELMIEEMNLAILFDNDQKLIDQYKKLKGKK